MINCPRCGTPILPGRRFCHECGTSLHTPPIKLLKEERTFPWPALLPIAVLLGCLVCSLWSGIGSTGKNVGPTPTPKNARDNAAIRAVMDYMPGKEETILHVMQIVIAMGEQTGNDIEIEGWSAIPRDEDWEVQFCFIENGTRACATFWYDPQKGTVAPTDYRGKLFFDAAKAW